MRSSYCLSQSICTCHTDVLPPSLGAQIMWPRLDSGHLASVGGRKLGGFVAYLRRPDAERAAKEMDGVEWGDNIIKISWGKAVPVAARAMYGA